MIVYLLSIFYSLLVTEFMSVDEIKPGMKGYGLSVFKGTKIDTFQVEIIDVMRNELPKGDVILARISGKVVDTAGVISGMSGSPIYIYENRNPQPPNPKLIGALAYSYAIFAKEPIIGITPIEEMLHPPTIGYTPPGEFTPIKIPMICPGLPDELLQELEKELPRVNLLKVPGSGKLFNDSIIPEPGSALGIPLVMGDVTWYGVGTCTYREGNKIWGFGHPMAELGETELPMTAGYIYSVIPSSYDSYKMGAPTKVVGTIKHDNPRGIVGVIGTVPSLIDFNISIKDEKFHYQVIKEKTFLPILFKALFFHSLYTGFKGQGEMTAEVNLEVTGSDEFVFKNLYTGTPEKISNSVSEVFNLIQKNPFKKIEVKEIRVRLTPKDTIKYAEIKEVWCSPKEVKPGDTVNLLISFATYQEGNIQKSIQLVIPTWVKKGELSLSVESGSDVRNKAKAKLHTIEEFTRWLKDSPRDNELVITLSQKGASGWILGEEFPGLPPTKAVFVKEIAEAKTEMLRLRMPTDWVLAKSISKKLEVK